MFNTFTKLKNSQKLFKNDFEMRSDIILKFSD